MLAVRNFERLDSACGHSSTLRAHWRDLISAHRLILFTLVGAFDNYAYYSAYITIIAIISILFEIKNIIQAFLLYSCLFVVTKIAN